MKYCSILRGSSNKIPFHTDFKPMNLSFIYFSLKREQPKKKKGNKNQMISYFERKYSMISSVLAISIASFVIFA